MGQPAHEHNMPVYVYNPSLLDLDNMAVRLAPYSYCSMNRSLHFQSDWTSERSGTVGARLRSKYKVVWLQHSIVRSVVQNAEDPRMFRFRGLLFMFVTRKSVDNVTGQEQSQCWLVHLQPEHREVLLYFEQIQANERNWVPFVSDGRLFILYSMCPHVVLECEEQCLVTGELKVVANST